MSAGEIDVAVADSCEATRVGLRVLLTDANLRVVAESGCARDAVMEAALAEPDLLLADPHSLGWEIDEMMSDLTGTHPGTKIVIYTAAADTASVQHALRAGASGYLLKTTKRSELIEALWRAHQGETPLTAQLASQLVAEITDSPRSSSLSGRELETLGHVVDGLTNREIGRLMFVSEGTVKTYLKRAFAKLGVTNRPSAVRMVLKLGLIDRNPEATAQIAR